MTEDQIMMLRDIAHRIIDTTQMYREDLLTSDETRLHIVDKLDAAARALGYMGVS